MSVPWSNERVINLIQLVRTNECLWNSKNDDYKNRKKKCDAWTNVAEEMETSENIIKAKMHSIRSQFMRERKKIQNSMKSGAGKDDVYIPTWFPYQHLVFLLNSGESGDAIDPLDEDSHCSSELSVTAGEGEENNTELKLYKEEIDHNIFTEAQPPKKKFKKIQVKSQDRKLDNQYDVITSICESSSHRDSSAIYGEYVAAELRQIKDVQALAIVKNRINNLIFQAQMGKFNRIQNYEYLSQHGDALNNSSGYSSYMGAPQSNRESTSHRDEDAISIETLPFDLKTE